MKKNNLPVVFMRKPKAIYFSIEKVFQTLLPFLNAEMNILPYESKGLIKRLKNIKYLNSFKGVKHISGYDHYLLWYPYDKSILTIHDIESLRRKKGIRKWLFKKLWFDIPMKNATIVTTISEFTKDELLKSVKVTRPLFVVPNPITLIVDPEPKFQLNEKVNVLHIGTKSNKNLHRLIKALDGIYCNLTIIGKLNDQLKTELSQSKVGYVNKFNLSEEEMLSEYMNCDILSFVSTYEGFGLPIIEAQSIGRVVLTSNISSMPEVAGKGALFVNPMEINEIREGIKRLISSVELRTKLIGNGFENLKRFKPDVVASMYNKLYEKIDAV